ncbi:MAG TPA: carbohydrate kinase [Planococcus sp. (in: firmicutes)]|nr:carbohydrate kinase [Planococcus sp. (in: firmicutes)]
MTRKDAEILELIRQNPYLSQQEMAEALGMSRPTLANLISNLIKQGKIRGRAYVLPEPETLICIGGANVDRKMKLQQEMELGTSNPVSVVRSVGGVARNIAENLGRLGRNVKLLSIAGEDPEWNFIRESSASFMDTELTKTDSSVSTGSYTAVLNLQGEMVMAMADMDVYESLTPELISRHENALLSASMLILDLNCPRETVDYIRRFSQTHNIPLAIIPVSVPKMTRLGKELDGVTWLILNKAEAEMLLASKIATMSDWEQAVASLLKRGAENVAITDGSRGVIAGNRRAIRHHRALEVTEIKDVTGAGDAFSSAIIHSYLEDKDMESTIQSGIINASKTLQSVAAVRPELSANQLLKEMEELQS